MKNRQRKNLLYIVPNVRITGGPASRISDFKKVFLENQDIFIQTNKIWFALTSEKLNIVYVESGSNRMYFPDFFALLILKLKSRKIIVFIRDIYIELFPEEYKPLRKSITRYSNKISNLFLTLISDQMAFPTEQMGKTFFEKHPNYPKREYFALPPATIPTDTDNAYALSPSQKIGILFLGGTHYVNSGIERFIEISKELKDQFNFFVLTSDEDLDQRFSIPSHLVVQYVKRENIIHFMKENNIGAAYHTRSRNFYDDLTFPIKALDFINYQIPFLTEKHIPIEQLMGKEYELFVDWNNLDDIIYKTNNATINRNFHLNYLKEIAKRNTYKDRYNEIVGS